MFRPRAPMFLRRFGHAAIHAHDRVNHATLSLLRLPLAGSLEPGTANCVQSYGEHGVGGARGGLRIPSMVGTGFADYMFPDESSADV